jgi:putative copper resistance protein D
MLEPSLSMRVCAAAAFDVAYAVSAGTLLNRLWLGGSITSANEGQLRHWLTGCSLLMLVAIPTQLVLLAASMTGDLSWKLAWSSLPDVVTTHAGHVLTVSFCFVPFLLVSSVFSSAFSRRAGTWTGIALVLGITVYRAALGHAASDGGFTLRELVQFLHLSSIATWGGGVAIAGLVAVPQLAATAKSEEVIQFGRRLSYTVTIALIVVVLSGIYNGWKGLGGSLAPLPHTAWGRMLIVKLCIVLLTLFHGGRVRLLLRKKRKLSPGRVAFIRRWLRAEAFLMICVLIVSAWLANLPPANM